MVKPAQARIRFLQALFQMISIPVIGVLVVFNLRRILFSLATLLPVKRVHEKDSQPTRSDQVPDVLILAACRNEEEMIPGLCRSLAALDYPNRKVQVALIDDGSQDGTCRKMEACASGRPGWHVLSLNENQGKAGALNAALAQFSFGEIVCVFDADHRPEPGALAKLVRYFIDPGVAGVSGRTLPSNPTASPSAFYASVESAVHQMITMRAKDRLGLAPALLGSNCAYRRSSLLACGGFRKGALLEDSDLTLAFYLAGYRVHFAEDAVAYHQAPESVRGYLRQHKRWARGFNDASRIHSPALIRESKLSIPLRVELSLFSAGYLDRIALVGAGLLTVLSRISRSQLKFPGKILAFALLTPWVQVTALFAEQKMPRAMWLRLPWMAVFFILDILAAVQGFADSLLNRPPTWDHTERATERFASNGNLTIRPDFEEVR